MPWKFIQEFEVTGRGDFPLDMLRYDSCWPARSEDASEIANEGWVGIDRMRVRTVRLRRYVEQRTAVPTVDRWRSFIWSVDPNSIRIVR